MQLTPKGMLLFLQGSPFCCRQEGRTAFLGLVGDWETTGSDVDLIVDYRVELSARGCKVATEATALLLKALTLAQDIPPRFQRHLSGVYVPAAEDCVCDGRLWLIQKVVERDVPFADIDFCALGHFTDAQTEHLNLGPVEDAWALRWYALVTETCRLLRGGGGRRCRICGTGAGPQALSGTVTVRPPDPVLIGGESEPLEEAA